MTNAGERAARDAEIRRTIADPDLAHHEAAAGSELDRSYPRSRAVAGDDGSGLAPGLLLPDTRRVEPADGDPRPIHELTHHRGHTLIVLGGSRAGPGRVGDLVTELERRCGAVVDAVVGLSTRPDGPQVGRIDESVVVQLGVADVTVLGIPPGPLYRLS